jgi:ankyrin repeat protein
MFYFRFVIYLIVSIGYSFAIAGSYDDFFAAVQRDRPEPVKQLLQRGFDPNSINPQGEYALMMALRLSSLNVARVLIASPATQVEVRSAKDESPLMLAAMKGELEICRQLIARDADINKPGWAPLHYAASGGKLEVLQLLLDNYAYIDAASPNGTTPLMMAARYGSSEAVDLLLNAGADPMLKNQLGLTALDFAKQGGHPDAIKRLSAVIAAKGVKLPSEGW